MHRAWTEWILGFGVFGRFGGFGGMDLISASLVNFAQQQEEEVLVPHQELPNGAQPMEGLLPSHHLAFLVRLVISLAVDSIRLGVGRTD